MRSTADYSLPRTSGEARRLEIQSELLREATETLLDGLVLRPGMTCLDVGCGTGDAMGLIARRVGPTGRVVGLDLDTRPVRASIGRLAQIGVARFDVVEGDLFGVDAAHEETYDLVFSRYLLHHLPDPAAAIARMWSLTRPGGTLAILDIDSRATTTYPVWQPYEDVERLITELYQRIGVDNHIGHKLPHLFERAGTGAPDGTHVIGTIRTIAELSEFLPLLLDMARSQLLALGIATADELRALEAGLARAAEQPSTYCYRPMAVAVWKRRPAPEVADVG